MREKPFNVHISYSKADGEEFAKKLRSRLLLDEKGKQLKYWKGRSWMKEKDETIWNRAATAVSEAECQVVILTPDIIRSDYLPILLEYNRSGEAWICLVNGIPGMEANSELLPPEVQSFYIYNVETEWDSFVEDLFQHCQPGKLLNMAPDLPTEYVHRPLVYDQIKQLLYLSYEQEGAPLYLSLSGTDGYGKTTLAAALCHDREIQEHFHEGILWIDLNDVDQELEQVTKVYNTITGNNRVFYSLGEAADLLSRELYQISSDYLLVVDNVQRLHQFALFLGSGGSPVKILSTGPGSVEVNSTGQDGWQIKPKIFQVEEMEDEEADLLLTKGLELDEGGLEVARNLLEETGKCPLLIRLTRNAAIAQANDHGSIKKALTLLLATVKKIKADHAGKSKSNTAACFIEAILSLLPIEQRQRCILLGALRSATHISAITIYNLWDVEALEGEELLKKFAAYALIDFKEAKGEVNIHKVLLTYFKGVLGSTRELRLQQLHKVSSDAFGLPDAHAWQYHIRNQLEAGKLDRATALLSDYNWLKAKLNNTDIHSLLKDFCLIKERTKLLELLYSALSMSSVVLALEKNNLPIQLSQRLRFHLEELPNSFRDALEEDLHRGPCIPIRTAMHPIGKAVYTLDQESYITCVTAWRDKAIIGLYNGMIKVIRVESGETLCSLVGHTSYIEDLAVTGSNLVSSSWDKTVRTWNLETGKALHVFTDQPGPARNLAASGGVFVCGTGSYDKELGRWASTLKCRNVVTGKLLYSFVGQADYITCIAMADNVFVSSDSNKILMSRDLITGEQLNFFTGHTGRTSCIKIFEGIVIGANDEYNNYSIRAWDLETGKQLHVLEGHKDKITCMAVSGDILISGSDDGTLRSWSLSEGNPLHVFKGHSNGITGVSFKGDVIVSSSSDGTLRSWSLSSGKPLFVFYGHSSNVTSFAMFESKMISGSYDGTMKCWDINKSGQEELPLGHTGSIECVTVEGNTVVTGSLDATLKSWELTSGNSLQEFMGLTDAVTSVSTAGSIVVGSSSNGSVISWELSSGNMLHRFQGHTDYVSDTVISGGVLLTASIDKTIRSWNMESGSPLRIFRGHTGRIFCLSVSGGVVVSGSDDETLRSWELATGKELHVFKWHKHSAHYVAISGDIVVSGEQSPRDDTLKSWNLLKGEAAQEFKCYITDGHLRGTSCIAVSGEVLVSAGRGFDKHVKSNDEYSYTLISWDLATGKMLHKFLGHFDLISSLQISEGICISGSYDGSIRIWNLKDGSSIATIYTSQAVTKLELDPLKKILIAGGSRGGLFFYQLNENLFPSVAYRDL